MTNSKTKYTFKYHEDKSIDWMKARLRQYENLQIGRKRIPVLDEAINDIEQRIKKIEEAKT